MATVIETKSIGLDISMNGSFENTEFVDGALKLKLKPNSDTIYESIGMWTSSVIDIGDNFKEFENVVVNNLDTSDAYFKIETRTSANGNNFDPWLFLGENNNIISEKNRYIQIRITLYPGVEDDSINFSDLVKENKLINITSNTNDYLELGLTTNTSSNLGFSFADVENTTYQSWRVFDGTSLAYRSLGINFNQSNGFVGFKFNDIIKIESFRVRGASTAAYSPQSFVLEGSIDTTTGLDGTWYVLTDIINVSWNASELKEFTVNNPHNYKGYRLHWLSGGTNTSYTSIIELQFKPADDKLISLNREVNQDYVKDESWNNQGFLYRSEIKIKDWLKINKLNIIEQD